MLVGLRASTRSPFAIEEGRKILRNVQRVAKLFVAKSVFAAVLILTVGVGGGAYPFLPRQLSLAAAFTVGIPTFFLALAPPPPERRSRGVPARRRSRSPSRPASCSASPCCSDTVSCTRALDRSPAESQTTSTTILIFVGLYLVLVLESRGMRRSRCAARARCPRSCVAARGDLRRDHLARRRRAATSRSRRPPRCPVVVRIICTIFAIGALGALGLSLTRPGGEQVQVVRVLAAR